jgi:hypothetical protein
MRYIRTPIIIINVRHSFSDMVNSKNSWACEICIERPQEPFWGLNLASTAEKNSNEKYFVHGTPTWRR